MTSAHIIVDKQTSRSRGFGFVEMTDDVAAKKAIAELDGSTVEDRAMKVNEALPKDEKSSGSRNNPFRSGNGSSSNNGGSGGYNNAKSYNNTRY